MEPTRPQRQARRPRGRWEDRGQWPRPNQRPQALSPERDRGHRQLHPEGPCPGRQPGFCVLAGIEGSVEACPSQSPGAHTALLLTSLPSPGGLGIKEEKARHTHSAASVRRSSAVSSASVTVLSWGRRRAALAISCHTRPSPKAAGWSDSGTAEGLSLLERC